MTPQLTEAQTAPRVAPSTAKPVAPFNPLAKSRKVTLPTPANDTTETKRKNILAKRRRRQARLSARH